MTPVLNSISFRFVFLFLIGLSSSVLGQSPSPAIPFNPDVKTGQLSNGLKYYILKNAKPEKKVELRLVVNAGSMMEDEDQLGLAHFMEHMNFNGLRHFPHNEVVHYLQSIGVKFGADLNAYTSFDETVYILPVPSDNPNKVDSAFTILADWSGGALLDEKEIDNERGVVLEESRLGKGADDRLFKQWFPKYMNGSRYGVRLPIGKDSIIKNFKYEALKRFHHDWYRPNLECVIVVGDIDPIKAEQLIKDKFSGFTNPAFERTRPSQFDMPLRQKNEALVVSDPESQGMEIQIFGNSYKSKPAITEADFKDRVVQSLFSSMLAERYDELKNSERPPFVYGMSYLESGYGRGWDNYASYAACGVDQAKFATQALIREAMRVKKYGFTEKELERTKTNFLASYEHRFKEKDKTESSRLVNELMRKFLVNAPSPGVDWAYHFIEKILPTIQLSDLNVAAKKITVDLNSFAVLSAKTSSSLPDNKTFQSWIEEALKEKLEPYQEKQIAQELLQKKPVTGKIIKTEKNDGLGLTTYHLENGAIVTIKPTDYKNDQILLKAERLGGFSLYQGKDYESGQYSNNVVDEMGYGNFSNTDLRKFLTGKVAGVNAYVDTYTDVVDGSCSQKDLETFFQLLYLKLTSPRKDEIGFKSYVNREKQGIESLRSNPENVFFDSINAIVYSGNPKAKYLPSQEDYDHIQMNHAIEFYNKRFNSAYGFHYYIVGSFTENEIRPLIEQYIGGLKGERVETQFKDLKIKRVSHAHEFTLRKGQEDKAVLLNMIYGPTKYDGKEAFAIHLLNDIINNRIVDSLREKMGEIYGGGANVELSKIPYQEFTFSSYLPCAPKNADNLENALNKLIESLQKPGGILESDLQKVREAAKESYKSKVKTNDYWLMGLSHASLYGEDPADLLKFNELLDAVSVHQLTELAQKYLKGNNKLRARWLPQTDGL